MLVVYFSSTTENTKRFVEKVGLPSARIPLRRVEAPLEVDELGPTVQRVADEFAANIAAHPADWHMLQPMWPADFPAESAARAASGKRRG